MNRRILLILVAGLVSSSASADAEPVFPPAPNEACRRAVAAAERAYGIPAHLLAAIARVESGRRDPSGDTFNPWPWTINADGQGSFYDTKAQAVAAAQTLRQRATRSVDVGCMQISLTYHPDAFANLEQAFDPAANADYGARYLLQLYEKTNSWPKAVAFYHSATPELGDEYQRRVYAAWPEEQKQKNTVSPPTLLASAWAHTFGRTAVTAPIAPVGMRSTGRIIMQQIPSGGTPTGHSLDWYRAAPIGLAFRLR